MTRAKTKPPPEFVTRGQAIQRIMDTIGCTQRVASESFKKLPAQQVAGQEVVFADDLERFLTPKPLEPLTQ
jgi:hypothetical protein